MFAFIQQAINAWRIEKCIKRGRMTRKYEVYAFFVFYQLISGFWKRSIHLPMKKGLSASKNIRKQFIHVQGMHPMSGIFAPYLL